MHVFVEVRHVAGNNSCCLVFCFFCLSEKYIFSSVCFHKEGLFHIIVNFPIFVLHLDFQ